MIKPFPIADADVVERLDADDLFSLGRYRWRKGPWDVEPDKAVWRDRRSEPVVPCMIVRGAYGALCGYVGVERGHPWYGVHFNDIETDDLTRLSYSDLCQGDICHKPAPGESHDVWWVGFDCMGTQDVVPAFDAVRVASGRPSDMDDPLYSYKDVSFVCHEVALLADQARAALR